MTAHDTSTTVATLPEKGGHNGIEELALKASRGEALDDDYYWPGFALATAFAGIDQALLMQVAETLLQPTPELGCETERMMILGGILAHYRAQQLD